VLVNIITKSSATAEIARVGGQWRRQDLLREGAKLESRSWGTHGELQGWVQQLRDD